MDKVGQLVDQKPQTKPSETTYRSSEQTFAMVWRGLQAARLISRDGGSNVGGTDYLYWRSFLRDLSAAQLEAGLKAAPNFEGYLTVGAFKTLCLQAYNTGVRYSPIPPTRQLEQKAIPKDEWRRRMDKLKAFLADG